ncbi:DUF1573 domain-containing protein [Ichthyenterobacterium magnum]|uniref:Uncharacterized protein DUF1573 n=1 Tax=Ichthyenterobacterium magnum TaxID=1230530 RepID=A0A420DFR2_9FLAO|nr:DUF1573 domain-containing protein [Ichthyenterobacterium magnum]RKE92012.1 uncharacterized protein DUF1573 [Ichthyenterobacterium magnum]
MYQFTNQIKNNSLNEVVLCIAFIFISSFIYAQDLANTTDVGVFSFEEEEINYGTIAQNANGERVFKFENRGRAPIVISKVKTTCGCTVPTYPKQPILPGQSGEIKIKYATNRVGPFTKSITVMSNAFESKKVLKIKGKVLAKNTTK